MLPQDGDREHSAGDETQSSADGLVRDFRQAWSNEEQASLADFLAGLSPRRVDRNTYLALALCDLDERGNRQLPIDLANYFTQFPEIADDRESVERLIAAHMAIERRAGGEPSIDDYVEFVRRLGDVEGFASIEQTTRGRSAAAAEPTRSAPQPGEKVEQFRVLGTLGAGAYGCVYLAWDEELDRPVALKISPMLGDEGRTLARLDHDHIATVFSQFVWRDQRVLAMRLVVGASLADWMLASQLPEPRQWRGLQLIRWLRSRAQPIHDLLDSRWAPPELSSGGVTRDNYLRAVVNLVREVAEALSFAHQRGVVHRDVKPANILLEQTGRAVLADFNVSTRDQTDAEALLGGTLPYMSPEQLRAMLSDPGAADVGPAADVYSLGIILYELVSGVHPWEVVEAQSTDSVMRQMLASRLQRAPRMPPLARRRSPSVAAIVEKCLAPSIADRYESAEPLAVDLRRWLEERRLRHAKDPGGGERWVRWLRRNAIVASSLAASCAVLFALTGWLALHDAARRARVDKALALVESNWSSMEVDAVERQLEVANTSLQAGDLITPRAWTTEWRDAAARRFDKTVRVWVRRQRDDFRRRADRDRIGLAPVDPNRDALSAYGVLRDPQWERRSSYMFLPPAEREAVAEDIAELLVIAAHRRSDRGGEVASRVPAILERRDDIVELVGRVAAGKQPSMRPDSHEFTLHLAGVAAALDQNDQLAVDRFKTSLSMRPINLPTRYWTKFHHAFCCERLNRLSEAVAGYAACAELRRDSSWPLHNLGLIHLRLGEYSVAEQSFRRALRVDGARGSTRAQLALALHQLDRPVEALEEMDRAIDEFGVRSPETLTNRAVILHQLERVADARRDLNAALELDPDYAPASQALKLLDKTR